MSILYYRLNYAIGEIIDKGLLPYKIMITVLDLEEFSSAYGDRPRIDG
jgi:hypothetical protein